MSNPEMYHVGWEEAVNMVLSVINEMLTTPDVDNQFDKYTLDELAQRIV